MSKKPKRTVIEIYPACPKPKWMKIGASVVVLGEGRYKIFKITAIEHGRAAVVAAEYYTKGHPGGCWESFTKITRPGHFDEDYAASHPQLELPIKAKKSKTKR